MRVIEVLDQVRKVKAIEDNKIILEIKPHKLFECVYSLQEIFGPKLKEKNLELIIKNSNDDQTIVLIDEFYFINQVLGNILSNAIKFSKQDKKIYISWSKIANKHCLIIKDEGIGMPKEILENLFTENKQNSRSGTYGEIGTGYGMPIVKTFVNAFKGEIEITSKENEQTGTTVKIFLPIV